MPEPIVPPATPPVTPPATPPAVPPAPPAVPPAVPPTTPPATPPAEPPKPEGPKTILGGEVPPEPKPGETPKPEGKKDEPVKVGAPEKYADFKMPEGYATDPKALDAFKAIAKDANLSQEMAQKLVDFDAQSRKAEIESRLEGFKKQVTDWGKECEAHFGAEAKVQFGLAAKAVESFGSPALRTFLNESGIGNHPEFVKMCAKIGAAIAEDGMVEGRVAGGERKSDAEVLYPSMNKKS